jgi:hypothetical protein
MVVVFPDGGVPATPVNRARARPGKTFGGKISQSKL